ncbi:MAG: Ig-like domain-containing protein [Gemmatimonadaceae bacterium]
MMRRTALGLTSILFAGIIVGCGGKDASGPASIGTVSLSMANPVINEGQTGQVLATVADTRGQALSGRSLTWTSSSPTIATVDANGLVTGVLAGTATITARDPATNGTASGTLGITVHAVVGQVQVTGATSPVMVGQTLALSAAVSSTTNHPITDRTVSWSSSDQAVATVTSDGNLTGVSAGTSTVQATVDGVSGTLQLTIAIPFPTSVAFTTSATTGQIGVGIPLVAEVRDQAGRPMAGRQVTWSVSDANVATTGAGENWVKCANEGESCDFTGARLVRYGVAGSSVGWLSFKEVIDGTPCTNAVFGDPAPNVAKQCATVHRLKTSGAMTLRPLRSGNVTVRASDALIPTAVASTAITIANTGQVDRWRALLLPGSNPFMPVGGQSSALANAFDPAGNLLAVPFATITSSDPAVLTVAQFSGPIVTITGVSIGTANIVAAAPTGFTGAGDVATFVVVSNAPVNSVTVTINSSTLTVGQTAQATATLRDAQNNRLTGRGIAWSSSNTAVATVNNIGLVTAVAVGNANITATSEGKSNSAPIAVTAGVAPVASVDVSLGQPNLTVGQTTQATATLRDAQAHILTGRAVVWSSSNPSFATVDANGLVTALSPGSTNIVATSEGVIGTFTATVSAAGATQRFGYAVVHGAIPAASNDLTFNASGGAVTPTTLGTGYWRVKFAGLARGLGQSDIALVTAFDGFYCVIDQWASNVSDMDVDVRCYTVPGFAPANNALFSVMLVGDDVLNGTGRTAFASGNQITTASYNPFGANAYNSNGNAMTMARTGLGTYQATLGIFPRPGGAFNPGTGTFGGPPEIPLMSTVAPGGTTVLCSSNGVAVDVGTTASQSCATTGNAAADAQYNILVLSGGRTGSPWGFAYIDENNPQLMAGFQKQSGANNPITFTSSPSGKTVQMDPATVAVPTRGIQVMPNFSQGVWVTCGFSTVDVATGQYKVACRNAAGALVNNTFTIAVIR